MSSPYTYTVTGETLTVEQAINRFGEAKVRRRFKTFVNPPQPPFDGYWQYLDIATREGYWAARFTAFGHFHYYELRKPIEGTV